MKKTIIITGSTDGIGKLAAIKLAKDGHRVYLHGRNEEKLNRVIEEVKKETGNEQIGGFIADLSDLDAVRKMTDDVKVELTELDVLINNAGVYKTPVVTNKDGLDLRYVVNYLAPYVLTNALLPLLRKGNNARIVNLSSAAQASVSYDVLSGKSTQPDRATYAQSKLALTMWSFDLAKEESDVAVIAVNPGSLLNTSMVKEAFGRHWSPAEKGGDILHDLAVSNTYNGVTGKYFDNDMGGFSEAHADSYDAAAISKLITATKAILK